MKFKTTSRGLEVKVQTATGSIRFDCLIPSVQDVQKATRFKERHPNWPWDTDVIAKLITLHRIGWRFMVSDDLFAFARKMRPDLKTNKECRELAERNVDAVVDEITRVEEKLKRAIN